MVVLYDCELQLTSHDQHLHLHLLFSRLFPSSSVLIVCLNSHHGKAPVPRWYRPNRVSTVRPRKIRHLSVTTVRTLCYTCTHRVAAKKVLSTITFFSASFLENFRWCYTVVTLYLVRRHHVSARQAPCTYRLFPGAYLLLPDHMFHPRMRMVSIQCEYGVSAVSADASMVL